MLPAFGPEQSKRSQAHPEGARSAARSAGPKKATASLPRPREPLHPLQDGKPHPDCVQGVRVKGCAHHPGERKPRAELCSVQRCESSSAANGRERQRDAWNGTAEVQPRGVRHFGSTALGVFVFTLPAELRARCVKEKQRAFRKAARDLVVDALRRLVGDPRAIVWGRSYFHPDGDEEPGIYKPHENVLVPLRAMVRSKRGWRAVDIRRMVPRNWLGRDGWLTEAWRGELVRIFGQWWSGETAPPTLPFYEFRLTPEEKTHSLEYFGRVFPRWAGHPDMSLRPTAFGLAHWKHKMKAIACSAELASLPEFGACETCIAEGEEPAESITVFGADPASAAAAFELALDRHTCATCQAEASPYLEDRRIMRARVISERSQAPPPGSPPEFVRTYRADQQTKWAARFGGPLAEPTLARIWGAAFEAPQT